MLVYIKFIGSVNCILIKLSDNTERTVTSHRSSHLCLQMVWPKTGLKNSPPRVGYTMSYQKAALLTGGGCGKIQRHPDFDSPHGRYFRQEYNRKGSVNRHAAAGEKYCIRGGSARAGDAARTRHERIQQYLYGDFQSRLSHRRTEKIF